MEQSQNHCTWILTRNKAYNDHDIISCLTWLQIIVSEQVSSAFNGVISMEYFGLQKYTCSITFAKGTTYTQIWSTTNMFT